MKSSPPLSALPELAERSQVGSWLVRHALAVAAGIVVLLLATLGAVLAEVPVETGVDALGILEPLADGDGGDWRAVLEVPRPEIDAIRPGDTVRITVPAPAGEAGAARSVPATVTSIGSATIDKGAAGVFFRVHARLDRNSVDASLPRGTGVEARVATGSERALDLLLRKLGEGVGSDG